MAKNTGKVREKSGNFVSPEKWEPCQYYLKNVLWASFNTNCWLLRVGLTIELGCKRFGTRCLGNLMISSHS